MSVSIPMYWFAEVSNFGDLLGPALVKKITGLSASWVSPQSCEKWMTVGSILEQSRPRDSVWGSGTKYGRHHSSQGRRIFALRGPRSLALMRPRIRDVPLGDPAVLLPMIEPSQERKISTQVLGAQEIRVGLIPHYVDKAIMRPPSNDTGYKWVVIDVQTSWRSVVQRIAACDVVVSSSLHGLIVAESYGVPAVWVQPSPNILGGYHKFLDYFEGTDREIECSVWEDVCIDPCSFAAPTPDLGVQRKGLLNALAEAVEHSKAISFK